MRTLLLSFLIGCITFTFAHGQSEQSGAALIQVKLPNGQVAKRDSLVEGESFTFGGFSFPFQYLNGGELHFPEGSLPENITIDIEIPDFASIQANAVSFGDSVASAVRFIVTANDEVVSPYYFGTPVELSLPVPQTMPSAIGADISELVLSFRDTTGNFDTTGIRTISESVLEIITAEVAHFSDIVMTSSNLVDENVALIQLILPNGQIAKRDSLVDGETFTFSGFAFPFQYLNGGELHFPEGAIKEDITINIEIPDFATIQANAVSFGDSVASAVRFVVEVADTAVSPYYFGVPVELTLPVPATMPPAIGAEVSQLVLSFRDEEGNFDRSGIKTVSESVMDIVTAQVAHFSDIVMTSVNLSTGEVTSGQIIEINKNFVLDQNYPNPFNQSTTISYKIPQNDRVSLAIYDISGKLVKTLVNEEQKASSYSVEWNATSNQGQKIVAGIYICKLQVGKYVQARQMIMF